MAHVFRAFPAVSLLFCIQVIPTHPILQLIQSAACDWPPHPLQLNQPQHDEREEALRFHESSVCRAFAATQLRRFRTCFWSTFVKRFCVLLPTACCSGSAHKPSLHTKKGWTRAVKPKRLEKNPSPQASHLLRFGAPPPPAGGSPALAASACATACAWMTLGSLLLMGALGGAPLPPALPAAAAAAAAAPMPMGARVVGPPDRPPVGARGACSPLDWNATWLRWTASSARRPAAARSSSSNLRKRACAVWF